MALCYLLPPKSNSVCFASLPKGETQVRVKLCHLSVFKSYNFFGQVQIHNPLSCVIAIFGEGCGGDESKRHRAESQWIVAARPLCHLQYPVAYLSRLQRIQPAAR